MRIDPGSVWAPAAEAVELVTDGASVALDRSPEGVWRPPPGWSSVGSAGGRYGFRLDGGEVLADPRSRWQPEGPTGLSGFDRPDSFDWGEDEFVAPLWSEAVLYELHIGTFSEAGTFIGAVEHLDHLAELGVTHVELMPVGAWVGRWGWGYDGVCWWAPQPSYGDPDNLRALVAACHQRGLAVLLDVVFNHVGPDGALLDRFGPYTRPADTPWGRALNLDSEGSGPVRDYIVDCALMWLADYRIDGLRLDAVHAMEDRSRRHIVADLTAAVDQLSDDQGRELVVVAEWDRHDPVVVVDRRDGGWGCRAHWADDLHHALHVTLTGETKGYYADAAASPDAVLEALQLVYVPRRATGGGGPELATTGLSRSCFIVCLQNHDQIGNRAAGERITALTSYGAVMAALPLVLLGPSVPLLFQGEEWASTTPFPFFADHPPDLAREVLAGRLAEFPDQEAGQVVDPGSLSTFESARLQWSEAVDGHHSRALGWYRSLLQLRRQRRKLAAGEAAFVRRPDPSGQTMAMIRHSMLVICNLAETTWEGDPTEGHRRVDGTLLSWGEVAHDAAYLGPHSAAVFELR